MFQGRVVLLSFVTYTTQICFVICSGCYYAYNSTILNSPQYVDPCIGSSDIPTTSETLNCCDIQANNSCLSDSLCFDPNRPGGAYYLSPCTDATYSAPECPQYWSELPKDVVELYAARLCLDVNGVCISSLTGLIQFIAPTKTSLM